MKQARLNKALVIVWAVSFSAAVFAKGSGGGHGSGGHGSGGHGSGGHASGGHASGGHGNSGGHGSSGSAGSSHGRSTGSGTKRAGGSRATPAGTVQTQPGGRRTNGTVVGTAVPRARAPVAFLPQSYATFRVLGYSGGGLGYGGLGLLYDPFWPGYGFGYSSYGYGPGPVSFYPGYGDAPDPFDRLGPTGSIRLNVEPVRGDVYVDGYFAGVVDDFDGHFQHLDLTAGPHHIEIIAPGYETLVVDVTIQPHHKLDYRGALTRSIP
jgi:hypothetical protein